MKINRLLFVSIIAVMLLAFTFAAPPIPSVAHPAAPASAQDTVTVTPSGCDGWQLDTPYPVPIMGSAVVSLGGYMYSFGGSPSTSSGNAAYKFDGSTWTAIASLPISRSFASAVSDGTNIYIVNGRGVATSEVSNSLYRYNPATDTYTELAPSRFPTSLTASAYLNGKIYRIGGIGLFDAHYIHAYGSVSTLEIYDIGTNTWEAGSNYPMPVSGEVAIARNGYIYVAGGEIDNYTQTNKTYRYDTITNLWEDEPIADLPSIRFDVVAGVLNNKWTITSSSNQDTLQWDEGTNTWTQGAPMLQPLPYASGAVFNNYLYVVGGRDGNNGITTTQRYNNSCPAPTGTPPSPTPTGTPSCERWQQQPAYPQNIIANAVASDNSYIYSFGGASRLGYAEHSYKYDGHHWRQLADLPAPVTDASAVTDNRYFYIINGYSQNNLSDAIYRYDPAADSYITLTHALLATELQGAAYLNNKIYIIGGNATRRYIEYTSTVQVYDITNNTWSRAAPYPTLSRITQPVVIDGYIYVADGTDSSGKTYRYDPQADTWDDAAVADLPVRTSVRTAGLLNGQWLLISVGNPGNQANIWNPATNIWRSLPNTLVPRNWAAGATLGNAFFLIGGDYMFNGLIGDYYGTDNQRFTTECPIPTPQPSPTTCPVPFIDINHNVFYSAIAYLYCRGAVSGTDATHYSPAATSTRGQFARVIVLGFGIPIVTPAGGAQSFTDVRPSYYAYSYIESGLAAGILSGYDAATCNSYNAAFPCYRPNRPITRAELTKLVVEAAGYPLLTPAGPTYVDVPTTYFAYSYIETASARGIVRGTYAGHFSPNRVIRRDEMAQIVYKGVTTPLGYLLALSQWRIVVAGRVPDEDRVAAM